MIRLRKYFKLLLVIFILFLTCILLPDKTQATAVYHTGDITVTESVSNSTDTGTEFVIKFSYFSGTAMNSWWMYCNQHGAPFKEVDTLYYIESRNVATPEEAYILSVSDDLNAKGYYRNNSAQWAWWSRGTLSASASTDTLWVEDLSMSFSSEGERLITDLVSSGRIASSGASAVRTLLRDIINSYGSEGATSSNINTLYNELLSIYNSSTQSVANGSSFSAEAKAYATYIDNYAVKSGGDYNYISYTVDGTTVLAPELDMEFNLYTYGIDTSGNITEADVSFSEDDNAYIIGPFTLDYPQDSYGDIIFAGIEAGVDYSDVILETNLGEMKFGRNITDDDTDWSISYTSSYASAADINGLPNNGYEFYIVLKYKPGMTRVTKLQFTFKYLNAGGYWNNYNGYEQLGENGVYYPYDYELTDSDFTDVSSVTSTHHYQAPTYDVNGNCTDPGYDYYTWRCSTCGSSGNGTSSGHHCYECNICGEGPMTTSEKEDHKGVTYTFVNGDSITLGECMSVVNSQHMAVVTEAIRWYTYENVTWEGEIPTFSSITVEKTTVDESGNKVKIKDTFYFDIYVDYNDGEGEQLFETLAVSTKNGSGKKTSSLIYWVDGVAPTYRVEEHDKDGYTIDGPWSGTLSAYATASISAENIVKPNKGRIEIDKSLINSTDALETETFTFKILVWGTFKYNGGSITTYSADNPLELTGTITGSGIWVSEVFEWYRDSAPNYKISEIIPEGADYELVSSNDKTGTLITNANTVPDADIVNTVVSFVNQPTTHTTYLHVDKKLFDGSEPKSGEVFTAKVTITGDFTYSGSDGTWIDGNTLEIEITLDESNNWTWDSGKITWNTTTAPTYTVEETSMPENYEFSSITDQINSSTTNDFSSTLQDTDTYVTIYNNERDTDKAKIRVIKLSETDDLDGKTFSFKITVTGNFTYNGTTYTEDGDPLVIEDTVNAVLSVDTATVENDTLKEYGEFTWYADEEAPTYTVEEINIPDDASFVSISNNTKTVTNIESITDKLSDDTVVIKMINRGIETKETEIQIVKETIGNAAYLDNLSEDERTFTFEVKITGTFIYTAAGNETRIEDDGTKTTLTSGQLINVNNETLTLRVTVVGKGENVTGNNVWTSGTITWSEDVTNPTYTVTEVDIPEYSKFVSWSNRTSTVETSFISGTLVEDQTNVLTAINNITVIPQYGKIQIYKKAQTTNISGEVFYFTLTVTGDFTYNGTEYTSDGESLVIENIAVTADGDAWLSELFTWEGDTPTYTVKENLTEEQVTAGVEFVSIYNETQTNKSNSITGSLKGSDDENNVTVVTVTAINKKEPKLLKGRIQITKEYLDSDGNEIDGVTFQFQVKVTYANGATTTIPVEIESGTPWRSDYFYWESTEDAPTYVVTETSSGNWSSSINPSSGSLENNEIIQVTAINTGIISYSGKIKITKYVEDSDKVSVSDYRGSFTFNVTVSGSFSYTDTNGNTTNYVDDTMSLKVTININGTSSASWTSGTFKWLGDAPEYAVEETDIPTGWWLYSMTNSSGSLLESGTVEVTCTDQTGEEIVYDLTMEMGGKVWDDTDYTVAKEADKRENGLIDEGEAGVEGVKVTITRVVKNSSGTVVATLNTIYAYDENDHLTPVNAYTYTDSDGNWSFGSISVPAFNLENSTEESYYNAGYDISYNVTFSYDGQTYEPTTLLATSNGNASSYKNASTAERDNWLMDSMAIDDTNSRLSFNAKFTNIEGDTPIDSNGETLGKATGSGTNVALHYTSTDSISVLNSDNSRKVSTLETYDENGDIYSELLIDASTLNADLTYPFDDAYHLESWDKDVNSLTGLARTTYHFSATYQYLLSINLGLIKREAADVSLEKDLTEAIVVINGKVLKYKYNSAIDLDNPDNYELLYKQIAVADEEIEYTLGLYSSDYYYRAAIYDTDSELGSALDSFYTSTLNISSGKTSTELEIYLKYTINVYNESDTYDVTINEIADYYDETFTLITDPDSQSKTYIQTLNGEEVNETRNLAETSTVTYYDSSNNQISSGSVSWSNSGTISGSDGIEYNKIVTNSLRGTKLASGQRAEIQVTFKVNKTATVNGVANSLELGEKHNVAEITSFTSYYSSNSKNKWSSAGQVAGRVDEDSAPDNVNITYYNDKTWYEDDTDSAPILTIELYNIDREVNGLVWEDSQTNTVQYSQVLGNGIYNPDEGDKVIAGLTTEIVETISIPTGEKDSSGNTVYKEYDFIWPTDESLTALGGQSFEDVTGFDSTIVTDASGEYAFKAVPAGNYKVRFVYGDTKILTGNTDDELVYNGQDYKSTSYQVGFDNDSTDDGYTDNEWHDLDNEDLNAARVSDARDVEARRLYVASKSEILQYDNTSVLATADEDVLISEEERTERLDNGETYLVGTTDEISDAEVDEEYYYELFGYGTVDGEIVSGYEAAKALDSGDIVTGDYGKPTSLDDSDNASTGYYMYAETAKLNLEVENINDLTYISLDDLKVRAETDEESEALKSLKIGEYTVNSNGYLVSNGSMDEGGVAAGNEFTYAIENIDFGLEERSRTELTLDKQIKEITLTTSDGNVILDAIYDIVYELGDDDTIKSSITLNKSLSTGYDNIASLNRSTSTQGYRYINVDSTILQGATVTVQYQLTVFNVGEADTCNQILKDLWTEVNSEGYDETTDRALTSAIEKLSSPYYTVSSGRLWTDLSDKYEYGTYLGSIYYLGTQGTYTDDNILVESTVHQIIDYVDPDVEFTDTDNISVDQSWTTASIDDLISYADSGLIDSRIIQIINTESGEPVVVNSDGNIVTSSGEEISEVTYYNYKYNTGISSGAYSELTSGLSSGKYEYSIINDYLQEFITESKDNVIISIDNGSDSDEAGTNPGLVKATYPYNAYKDEDLIPDSDDMKQIIQDAIDDGDTDYEDFEDYSYDLAVGSITLQVSRYYSSEEDSSDIDNIAEIIKVENTVGRRDIRTIAGNTSTYELVEGATGYDETVDIYTIAGYEPDTSATEVITLSPPTGLNAGLQLVLQIIAVVLVAGIILAVGIIFIKKKVLVK